MGDAQKDEEMKAFFICITAPFAILAVWNTTVLALQGDLLAALFARLGIYVNAWALDVWSR